MTGQKRKDYKSPRIKRVKLIPEEAVIAACKRGSGSGRGELCNRSTTGCTRSATGS